MVAVDVEGVAPNLKLLGLSFDGKTSWVYPWKPQTAAFLSGVLKGRLPIFHNASFDIPELRAMGVEVPNTWIDTINLAALVNPDVKLGLEAQVLTYIEGSTAYKGLIEHRDIELRTPKVILYERLWTEILTRLGRKVPESRYEWYVFYNGLDAAHTYMLAFALRRELEATSQMRYYRDIMQPLQPVLLDMGQKGMPLETEKRDRHRRACERLERMAQCILDGATESQRQAERAALREQILILEGEREREREAGTRRFSRGAELSRVRTRLNATDRSASFNGDSAPQRLALLYEHLGLPEARNRKTKRPTSDDKAVEGLISRLRRGTISPKGNQQSKVSQAEAIHICKALIAIKKWGTWRRNFLTEKDS